MSIRGRTGEFLALSVQRLCRTMKISRSLYYRASQPKNEPPEVEQMRKVLEKFPRYGYRRIAASLNLGCKRARTLMKRFGLVQKRRSRRGCTVPSRFGGGANLVQNLRLSGPCQMWASDVTAVRLEGRKMAYVAVVLDVFTREAVGFALSMKNDTGLTIAALEMAYLNEKPAPGWVHHSDRGANYTSHDYLSWVVKRGGISSFSEPGKPTQNAFAESFFKSFKTEEGGLDIYSDIEDATTATENYMKLYNNERLHSAIGMKAPMTFKKELALLS